MIKKLIVVGMILVLALSAALFAFAQGDEVATGFNNPRHITFDADGVMYVAEAGNGGDETITGELGDEINIGLTAQVSTVSPDGEVSVLFDDLFSRTAFGGNLGAHKVIATADSYWVLLGEDLGTVEIPFEGVNASALVQYDRETMEVVTVIDLYSFEAENNSDGVEPIASNPTDFAVAEDGTIYIVDASANALLAWTEADGLSLVVAWGPREEDGLSNVPTSIDIGPDGELYVGFLGGFPFDRLDGSARVEQWVDGELTITYPGLNLVTDVMVDDEGTVYAVEMADGFGDTGYIPESGRIVEVTEEGPFPLVENLNFPYGMTIDPNGNMLVNVDTAFSAPDAGTVIVVGSMGGGMDMEDDMGDETEDTEEEDVEEPSATEEADS